MLRFLALFSAFLFFGTHTSGLRLVPEAPGPPNVTCAEIDVIFLLDESETVMEKDPTNWQTVKNYIINLTTIFTIDRKYTRVGVVGYGRIAQTQVQLGLANFQYEWSNMVQGMQFLGGARNVQRGFQEAINQIKRFGRQTPKSHVFVVHIVEYAHDILDDDPTNGAKELGRLNVTMYTAAIENYQWDTIFQKETELLTSLAYQGTPFKSKAFNVTKYPDLGYPDQLKNEFKDNVIPLYPC